MKTVVSIGFTEPHLLMVSDILFSKNLSPKILILDNQKRFNSEKNFIYHNYDFINSVKGLSNLFFGFAKPIGKYKLFDLLELDSNNFINLIHRNSEISIYSEIGKGVRIEPNTVIAAKTKIGNFVNINRNVSIGHHCVINDFVTINPSCSIAGYASIGENTEICIGTTIIDGVNIGKNTIIGAGSLVTKDIPDNVVAYGNPCKIIRENII
jgi:sugar O-acyltransferase (sialic acid O-acetyltransferase NeuD family)